MVRRCYSDTEMRVNEFHRGFTVFHFRFNDLATLRERPAGGPDVLEETGSDRPMRQRFSQVFESSIPFTRLRS